MYSHENSKATDSEHVRKEIPVRGKSDTRSISNRSHLYRNVTQMKLMGGGNNALHHRLKERINSRISQNSACIQCVGHRREFQGTKSVPVTLINEKRVATLLESCNSQRAKARKILENGFTILAGIHKGGIGGAVGGPDPKPHITIRSNNTTYHLHVRENRSKRKNKKDRNSVNNASGLLITDITP